MRLELGTRLVGDDGVEGYCDSVGDLQQTDGLGIEFVRGHCCVWPDAVRGVARGVQRGEGGSRVELRFDGVGNGLLHLDDGVVVNLLELVDLGVARVRECERRDYDGRDDEGHDGHHPQVPHRVFLLRRQLLFYGRPRRGDARAEALRAGL